MSNLLIETLVSTMEANVKELYKKMNLKNNAIFINQQSKHYYRDSVINNNLVKEYAFDEKGIGLSRNSALMRSTGDICLMADDDMVYTENYLSIVKKEYEKYPDADMIIFNVRIHDDSGINEKVKKNGRVHYLNSLKYGTVTFSFKREKILKENIFFSVIFGGGAKYSNGEDSIFLWDCLKAGLNIYSSTEIIADVYNFKSSWFEGYNDKFFMDRGALFEALSSNFSIPLIYQYAIRKRKLFSDKYSVNEVVSLLNKGRKLYKRA